MKIETLLLAALLHDIGKFEFRADGKRKSHYVRGYEFFQEKLKPFRSLIPDFDALADAIRHHHEDLGTLNPMEIIIKRADELSAAERKEDEEAKFWEPLRSIFAQIDIGKTSPTKEEYSYNPSPLSFDKDFFPIPEDSPTYPSKRDLIERHHGAWSKFLSKIELLPDSDFFSFYDSLLSLLEIYTSKVASASYKTTPDISLFDHLKATSAIAHCLHTGEESEPFLLLLGDISGIQNFIYKLASPEIAQKGMSRRLRGRSLYLQLLTDTIAHYLMERCGIYRNNLLFSGGGHFILLIPHNQTIRGEIDNCRKTINQMLYEKFRGDLYLALGSKTSDRENIKEFSFLLDEVFYRISQAKERRFFELLEDVNFGPFSFDGTLMDVCPVCQKDFPKKEGKICHDCQSHMELGGALPKTKYLLEIFSDTKPALGKICLVDFSKLGIYWCLLKGEQELEKSMSLLKPTAVKKATIYSLNIDDYLNKDILRIQRASKFPTSLGYYPLSNYAPQQEDGSIMEFEELAEMSDGYPLLAIARMDVDSLGAIFSQGLGEDKTLSRVSSLSRQLNLFFSGYLNYLAQKHKIYITYSGGDDLFAVGSWTDILNFARSVYQDFRKYTCYNDNITLSGGIFICKDSYPIGRGAQMAGQEEYKAKGLQNKDALSLFYQPTRWERLEDLLRFAEDVLPLLQEQAKEDEKLARSFIHGLLSIRQRYFKEDHKQRPSWVGSLRGLLHYHLARREVTKSAIEESEDKPNKKVRVLSRLLKEPDLMRDIIIPANYLILKTRRREER